MHCANRRRNRRRIGFTATGALDGGKIRNAITHTYTHVQTQGRESVRFIREGNRAPVSKATPAQNWVSPINEDGRDPFRRA